MFICITIDTNFTDQFEFVSQLRNNLIICLNEFELIRGIYITTIN